MKDLIKELFHSVGLKISKYPTGDLKRRLQIINHFKIDLIFDVGANIGQYAILMRKLGFKGKIISFEPRLEAYEKMVKKSTKDKGWIAVHSALGNEDGKTEINVAGNLFSSSILDMKCTHLKSAPESAYTGNEEINISKLDSIFTNYVKEKDQVWLKIDTQGFEKSVLDGAENSLSRISGIQLEMSLTQLYEGELLYMDMIKHLESKGYTLYSLEAGFSDPKSGRLLQVDGIFFKENN